MNLRPKRSARKPPMSAPTAAPKAFAPTAPKMDTHTLSKLKAIAQAASATPEATMQPESRKLVSETAMVPFFSWDRAIVLQTLS